MRAPWLLPPPVRTDYRKSAALGAHLICTVVGGAEGYDKFKLCHYAVLSAELVAWGIGAAATATTVAPALVAGGAILLGLVLGAVVIFNLVAWLTGGCDPCSLICFINCPPLALSNLPPAPPASAASREPP